MYNYAVFIIGVKLWNRMFHNGMPLHDSVKSGSADDKTNIWPQYAVCI